MNHRIEKQAAVIQLTERSLHRAAEELAAGDSLLTNILNRLGVPPLWARKPGFPTLVHIILEQQVSLASALAAYRKLDEAAGTLTPESFLKFSDQQLKQFGFSRQKTTYCRHLAQAIRSGRLHLHRLQTREDHTVRKQLMAVKGIGRWTADIYLLMALRRPDVWPAGDLALRAAVQDLLDLPERPGNDKMQEIGARWKPYRAVAARLFWHHYLNSRRKND